MARILYAATSYTLITSISKKLQFMLEELLRNLFHKQEMSKPTTNKNRARIELTLVEEEICKRPTTNKNRARITQESSLLWLRRKYARDPKHIAPTPENIGFMGGLPIILDDLL